MRSAPAIAAARGRLWPGLALIARTAFAPGRAAAQQPTGPEFVVLDHAVDRADLAAADDARRRVRSGRRAVAAGNGRRSAKAAPEAAAPMVPAGKVALALSARFGKDAPPIDGGLTWRVYAAEARRARQFPAGPGRQVAGAHAGAAGRQLRRACRLRARHRGQAGDLERADRARAVRSAGRRPAHGRPRRRRAASRPDRFRSTCSRAANSSPATAGRSPST